jgi:hypothetical protein
MLTRRLLASGAAALLGATALIGIPAGPAGLYQASIHSKNSTRSWRRPSESEPPRGENRSTNTAA